METRSSALYLIVLVLVILFIVWGFWNRSNFTFKTPSGFSFKTYPTSSQTFDSGTPSGPPPFNNSEYQTYPPSVDIQEQYYQCVANDCAGDTYDYPCLQRCHLKTYRRYMNTPDIQDWVCYYHRHNEDDYYKCLANVYADYKYP